MLSHFKNHEASTSVTLDGEAFIHEEHMEELNFYRIIFFYFRAHLDMRPNSKVFVSSIMQKKALLSHVSV